ncbi:hypothetical protein V2J09_012973 [Rumex salicifolius]
MSSTATEDVEMVAAIEDSSLEELKDVKHTKEAELLQRNKDLPITSPTNQQVEMLKKKYGGLLPKKPPLISKDHEHAFFDSADWALGKQGGSQKAKGPLEALRPKLEPTPHHHARSWRSTYAPAHDDQDAANVDVISDSEAPEDDDACAGYKNVAASTEGESTRCDCPGNP